MNLTKWWTLLKPRTIGKYYVLVSRKIHSECHAKPIYTDPVEIVKDIPSGATLLVGGFGMCGVPENLIVGLKQTGVNGLTVVSNNGGVKDFGLGWLLQTHQIKRMISSYIGENPEFERQYLEGELEVEFTPQGTMIERVRAGAAGIPAFYTRTGYGTLIHHGGCPIKHDKNGKPLIVSEPRQIGSFNGVDYLLEHAIKGDFALIHAWKADRAGNLKFRKTAQNFNSTMAKAAKTTIVEVEELLPIGSFDPDEVHLPGIYVDRILANVPVKKRIERMVLRDPSKQSPDNSDNPKVAARIRIAKRAIRELENGQYVNLGIGLPTLMPSLMPPDLNVHVHSENGLIGVGPNPTSEEADADLINAGKETVTELPGASHSSSCESFGMIRGGHIDVTFLGGMQVSEFGDLANWVIPGKLLKGMGGAMDLAAAPNTRVIVLMEHTTPKGDFRIVKQCNIPLTGVRCVNKIITDMGVFNVDPNKGLTLVEIAPDVELSTIKKATEAQFQVAKDLKKMF